MYHICPSVVVMPSSVSHMNQFLVLLAEGPLDLRAVALLCMQHLLFTLYLKPTQKQAQFSHFAVWGGPEVPLQKISQLQISCVQ